MASEHGRKARKLIGVVIMNELMKLGLIALNKYYVVLASLHKGHVLHLLQAAGIISKTKS
jgi:hypothetical protein